MVADQAPGSGAADSTVLSSLWGFGLSALITAGAGVAMHALGTMLQKGAQKGFATTERNPTAPWKYAYGRCRVGGTVVYMNSWPKPGQGAGGNDQILDMVIVLAAHSIASVDAVLFDMQRVSLDAPFGPQGVPTGVGTAVLTGQSGAGAMSHGPYPGTGTSFTPVQQQIGPGTGGIPQIQRSNGVVTVTLHANIPPLIEGDQVQVVIQPSDDIYQMSGTFQVEQIISQVFGIPGSITFTYLSGGPDGTLTGKGQVNTLWPDYGRSVYFEPMLGGQTLGQTFNGMVFGTPLDGDTNDIVTPDHTGGVEGADQPNPWTSNCSLLGKSSVFLRLHYSDKYYKGGIPQISFLVHGKNDILDPRTSPPTVGYSANSALCIADFASLPRKFGGFGLAYGSQIPTADLVAAANVCDEPVPLAYSPSSPPLTEPAYECNGQFDLSMHRGEILQNMLTSCAGRQAFVGGQFIIWPAAWIGTSLAIGSNPGGGVIPLGDYTALAAGPARWHPTSAGRDLFNGCRGTYISKSNKWTATDFPPYRQDEDHGYGPGGLTPAGSSGFQYDASLEADGGDRRDLVIQLPFTTSYSCAQRVAKIELLRRRNPGVLRTRGNGTLALNMVAYQAATLDLAVATSPYFGWSSQQLELTNVRLVVTEGNPEEGEGPALKVEWDIQETDPEIYDWSTLEELSPAGYVQPAVPGIGSFTFFPTETIPGVSVPYPWKPGAVAPLIGDALYPGPKIGSPPANDGPATFGLQVRYGTDSAGNPVTYLDIRGSMPPNQLSQGGSPQITCTVGTSGNLPPGRYIVAAGALDSSGDASPLSVPQPVTIPAGPSNGSIAVAINFPPDATVGALFMAENDPENGYCRNQTVTGAATITDFKQSTAGAPDPSFDHLAVAWTKEIHGGPWAQQVQAVTPTTITIAGAGMTANQWAGRVLSLLGKLDSSQPLIVLNMPVASNTASSSMTVNGVTAEFFVLTIGVNSAGDQLPDLSTLLEVGDLLIMRLKPTFTATSFSDALIANPYFPTGDSGIEAGHQAMVLTGPDAGDVQTIGSVSVDGFGNFTIIELANQWQITPNAGDIVIVVEAGWGPEQHSNPFSSPIGGAINGVVASPVVTPLAGQTWVVIARTQNSNSDNGLDLFAPVREIYDFGSQGTRTITTSQTALPTDKIVLVDATAGNVTYTLLPFYETPNQALFIEKIDSSTHTVTIAAAIGDTLGGATTFTLSKQYARLVMFIPGPG